jgi:hypothetical protein
MFYELKNNQFILDAMLINAESMPPKIRDIESKPGPQSLFDFAYRDLNMKEKFTGKIWLEKSSLDEKVVKITIENGNIISEENLILNKDDYNKRKSEGFKKKMNLESNVGTIFPK